MKQCQAISTIFLCMLLCLSSTANASKVAYYHFDETLTDGSSSSIENAVSSSWGDATSYGPSNTSLPYLNEAFWFYSSDVVSTNNRLSATGDWTIASWARVSSSIGACRSCMYAVYKTGADGCMYLMAADTAVTGSKVRLKIFGTSGTLVDLYSTDNILDNEYHFIAATRNGDTFSLYVDGILEDSTTVSNVILYDNTDRTLCIGNLSTSQYLGTYGAFDEMSIYDETLSAKDIYDVFLGKVAEYYFDETLTDGGSSTIANTALSDWGDATSYGPSNTSLPFINEAFWFYESDVVSTNNKLSATEDWTIAGWARVPSTIDSFRSCMYAIYKTGADGCMYLMAADTAVTDSKVRLKIFGSSGTLVDLYSAENILDDEYHFIAATRNGDTFSLYVDGILEDSTTVTGVSLYSGTDRTLCIGNLSVPQYLNTYGAFDEMDIYESALSDIQIRELYDSALKAENPSPFDNQDNINQSTWTLSWNPPDISSGGALTCDVYFDDDVDLNDATLILNNSTATSVNISLDPNTTYYWRVDYHSTSIVETMIGNIWSFATVPDYATNLYPVDEANGLPFNLRLCWNLVFDANSYNVYISDDSNDFDDETFTPVNTTDTFMYISGLDSDTTYYWMIDSMQGSAVYDTSPVLEFTTYRDLQSDIWVATDAVGRELPGSGECDLPRDKKVGIFYFLWLDYPTRSAFNVTDILAADPSDPAWGTADSFHWWDEPELGYYLSTDPYVLRKHASMLTDAGVDFVFLDLSNSPYYTTVYTTLCQVWQQMRDEGQTTPQICFLLYSANKQSEYVPKVQTLYENFYSQNLYPDLWFYWKGKPLILSPLTGLSQEVQDFFTIRDTWAWQGGEHEWSWLDSYPQLYGWDTDPNIPEQTSVCIAQHATSNIGRSFQVGQIRESGTQPTYNQYKLTGTEHLGLYFESQWEGALEIDPEILFITGWNEWVAVRNVCGPNPTVTFLGENLQEGDSFFVDQFNREYSRDAEPMKDGFTDNYYYQMIDGIRRYKGVSQPQAADEPFDISIDGTFTDWDNISLKYYDTYNDTVDRNYAGWDGYYYENYTGRNDIVTSKVAFDAYQIYFYVETADDLTSYTDPNWMMLFVNADQDPSTGWEGYDYIINRSRTSTTVSVEECLGGWSWQTIDNVPYSYTDNKLEIAVPRCDIMQSYNEEIAFDFHWADNIQAEDDIIEFAISGDSAPNRRFNYRYTKSVLGTHFDEDDNFEDWSMTHNLSNYDVSDGILSFDITGLDPHMTNSDSFEADSSLYKCIRIRMKNLSSSTTAQFYWTTNVSTYLSETKHVDFTVSANDAEFKDYVIDLSNHAYWDDTINELRFDPSRDGSSGSVEIDFIRLQDRTPTTGDSCE